MNLLFVFLLACADQSYTNPQKSEPEKTGSPKTVSPELNVALKVVLSDYEALRNMLANDSLNGVEKACDRIISESKKAEHAAPDQLKPKFTEVAEKAALLRAAKQEDMNGARKIFGDLSQPLIEILRSDDQLSEGLYLFKCPMAQDYQFWVQPKKDIENPYMGTEMLACGSSEKWR